MRSNTVNFSFPSTYYAKKFHFKKLPYWKHFQYFYKDILQIKKIHYLSEAISKNLKYTNNSYNLI